MGNFMMLEIFHRQQLFTFTGIEHIQNIQQVHFHMPYLYSFGCQ